MLLDRRGLGELSGLAHRTVNKIIFSEGIPDSGWTMGASGRAVMVYDSDLFMRAVKRREKRNTRLRKPMQGLTSVEMPARVTVKELCELSKCHYNVVRRYIERKGIKPVGYADNHMGAPAYLYESSEIIRHLGTV